MSNPNYELCRQHGAYHPTWPECPVCIIETNKTLKELIFEAYDIAKSSYQRLSLLEKKQARRIIKYVEGNHRVFKDKNEGS